jgi:hypothetical protein
LKNGDGQKWVELGIGDKKLIANGGILSLATDDKGNVYAAGQFRNSQGYRYGAKWNGNSWSELGK